MTRSWQELALKLFDIGAIQFGAFRLKVHETRPDAPLSPIYLNLRTADNSKPGPLTPDVLKTIGKELFRVVYDLYGIHFGVYWLAGVPNAGDPFADAFSRALGSYSQSSLGTLRLVKEQGDDGTRKVTMLAGDNHYPPGDRALLFDDLITAADSKLEAIAVLEATGLRVETVTVLVDREQGGSEELTRRGYNFLSVFRLSELLDLYVQTDRITSDKRQEVLDYIAADRLARTGG